VDWLLIISEAELVLEVIVVVGGDVVVVWFSGGVDVLEGVNVCVGDDRLGVV